MIGRLLESIAAYPHMMLWHVMYWNVSSALNVLNAWLHRGGLIIKQMREQSGALIKVMAPEELPPCALSNDRVVQYVSALLIHQ